MSAKRFQTIKDNALARNVILSDPPIISLTNIQVKNMNNCVKQNSQRSAMAERLRKKRGLKISTDCSWVPM